MCKEFQMTGPKTSGLAVDRPEHVEAIGNPPSVEAETQNICFLLLQMRSLLLLMHCETDDPSNKNSEDRKRDYNGGL